MALKRRSRIDATFSMASMTDVIFLLLIFFMVTSTIVFPNAIKVLLPQSTNQTTSNSSFKISIDKELNYYITVDNKQPELVTIDILRTELTELQRNSPESFVALYADEEIPYREVVKIMSVGAECNIRMVLATRPISVD